MTPDLMETVARARAENAPDGAIAKLAADPLFGEFMEFVDEKVRLARANHESLSLSANERAEYLRLLLQLRDEVRPWLANRQQANADLIKRNRPRD